MNRSTEGFSLLEALVGLTLIALALLFSMSILAQQPRLERRVAAHHEVLRIMESRLEDLRSVLVLPESGEIDLSAAPSLTAAQDLRMWVEVDAMPGRGLYEVELLARYGVLGATRELKLRSMIFTPPRID